MDPKMFLSPPRRYGIYPIIHRAIAEPGSELVDYYDRLGFAGVVGNVDYNDGFPDNPGCWEKADAGFRDCIRRGMLTWIYDEKGYPSGTAGGAVTENHPELVAQGLYCYEYWRTLTGPMPYRADTPGDRLWKAFLLPLDDGDPIDVTDALGANGRTLRLQIPEGDYHLFTMSIRRLFDGTHAAESYSEPRDYVSLSDPRATREFLRLTHEKYAEKLGDEFGRGVLAFFTDEPSLIAWHISSSPYPVVPYLDSYPDDFQSKYGYSFALAVIAVVTGRGRDVVRRRCDFWDFIADTVAENFFGVIRQWCHEHGVKSSGHMLWEEFLQDHVRNYGSFLRCARQFDWPGIDMLIGEPTDLMDPDRIPFARMLASLADISGERESFTEFSSHDSYCRNRQVGLEWVRASVNYHHAMGINNLTSYHRWKGVYGEEETAELNRYAARLGLMLRQGRRDSQTAILYPEATMWSLYTPSSKNWGSRDDSFAVTRLDRIFARTAWELLHRQVDFDYLEESLLQSAEIRGGRLRLNDREYRCVVLPGVEVASEKSVEKLVAMLENGIGVVAVGGLPDVSRETGRRGVFRKKFRAFADSPLLNVIDVPGDTVSLPGRSVLTALPRPFRLTPEPLSCILTGADRAGAVADGEPISANILSHSRILDDGRRMIFLTNMGAVPYTGVLSAEGAQGRPVTEATPSDGGWRENAYPDAAAVPVTVAPYEAVFYLI